MHPSAFLAIQALASIAAMHALSREKRNALDALGEEAVTPLVTCNLSPEELAKPEPTRQARRAAERAAAKARNYIAAPRRRRGFY